MTYWNPCLWKQLDYIYVKYLLLYDTLSGVEREELTDSSTDWCPNENDLCLVEEEAEQSKEREEMSKAKEGTD